MGSGDDDEIAVVYFLGSQRLDYAMLELHPPRELL